MERKIDIEKEFDRLNEWVRKSIELFYGESYLDKVNSIYNYSASKPYELGDDLKRKIREAHTNRDDEKLIRLLCELDKFPYDEPFWYLIKTADGFIDKNPQQVERIAETLYEMTDEEVLGRVESSPKLNQQTGPMFNKWIRDNFDMRSLEEFKSKKSGIIVLGDSEEEGKRYLTDELNQNVGKRPDFIGKVNDTIVIGEAKWIGQSGGNQYKSVAEVLKFCRNQRGKVRRIGLIDGYPWLTKKSGKVTRDRICVEVQESTYNLMSALLLNEFLRGLM